ncbi:hypothetical protein LENED_011103 [Lentinula edodes]|uniref:Uncharacterized protein n=1 Tax=Lentinula edodes TaxID=5353 RepID=A0A1Q3EP49_LENED|nr:hypothetical protein LENED_011103 [Lentinula edodes]
MSTNRTQTVTTTSLSTAGPSRSHPIAPSSADLIEEEENLEEDEDEIVRRVHEKVHRLKEKKPTATAKKNAEEEAAKKAAEEARQQKEGSSPEGSSISPWWPVVEIRKEKGKCKAKAQPVGGDPNDGGDGNDDDDDEDDRAPCDQYRSKKISCQMQAGKRSSVICKP